jgi:hypothetical protein
MMAAVGALSVELKGRRADETSTTMQVSAAKLERAYFLLSDLLIDRVGDTRMSPLIVSVLGDLEPCRPSIAVMRSLCWIAWSGCR